MIDIQTYIVEKAKFLVKKHVDNKHAYTWNRIAELGKNLNREVLINVINDLGLYPSEVDLDEIRKYYGCRNLITCMQRLSNDEFSIYISPATKDSHLNKIIEYKFEKGKPLCVAVMGRIVKKGWMKDCKVIKSILDKCYKDGYKYFFDYEGD